MSFTRFRELAGPRGTCDRCGDGNFPVATIQGSTLCRDCAFWMGRLKPTAAAVDADAWANKPEDRSVVDLHLRCRGLLKAELSYTRKRAFEKKDRERESATR